MSDEPNIPYLEDVRRQAVTLAILAREEDLGTGDATGALVHESETGTFRLLAKQRGVLAGRAIADAVLSVYGEDLQLKWADAAADGAAVGEDESTLATLHGPVATMLAAERVLLNFLQRLCGIATLTRAYVDAVAGTGAAIYDTRKTTPGWRVLEKYAVLCGGGCNHRMGLYDAVLIKDNHLAGVPAERLAGHIFQMLNNLPDATSPDTAPPQFVEVESDSFDQVVELFKVTGIDAILLDNFSLGDLQRAVEQRDALNLGGKVALEASGGITLNTIRAVAETGVDRISVGAITHSAPALDLALERCAE